MSDLAAALQIAIKVHADQRDKQGAPYLWHVMRVVETVNPYARVAAALHDVIEDGGLTAAGLNAKGIGTFYTDTVVELTRGEEPYGDYIERIATSGSTMAVEVKLADLRDNLGRIPDEPLFADEFVCVQWGEKWASLKARYEDAIATLEATQ